MFSGVENHLLYLTDSFLPIDFRRMRDSDFVSIRHQIEVDYTLATRDGGGSISLFVR